jgi:ferritin-like metal-binding protein YciE
MIKDATAKVAADAKNITALLMNDDSVNEILTLHTFTQTAIGLYKILIAAAESVNDSETKLVCLDILEHTEARAVWIAEELAVVTKKFLLKLA